MSDTTSYHVLKNRHSFEGISIPFPAFEAYERTSNKWDLFELANRLKLPIPRTHFLEDRAQLGSIKSDIAFSIVIKPYRSRILVHGRWMRAKVRYASSYAELERILGQNEVFQDQQFLLQQQVRGQNTGIFVLYDHGQPITFFAHRRLRQRPPSGGTSVLSESIPVDPVAREVAQRLFGHLQWHGVAMLECMVGSDGTPYILEVNARFWESLQLAFDAGIDFPWR